MGRGGDLRRSHRFSLVSGDGRQSSEAKRSEAKQTSPSLIPLPDPRPCPHPPAAPSPVRRAKEIRCGEGEDFGVRWLDTALVFGSARGGRHRWTVRKGKRCRATAVQGFWILAVFRGAVVSWFLQRDGNPPRLSPNGRRKTGRIIDDDFRAWPGTRLEKQGKRNEGGQGRRNLGSISSGCYEND